MTAIITEVLTIFSQGTKEILSVVSNLTALYSAYLAIINLLQLISNQGFINGTLSWFIISIVTSIVTGLIAEALNSAVPSPFRWLIKIIEWLMAFA